MPASSANLGPGFDVIALALALYLDVEATEATESTKTAITWTGDGAAEIPMNRRNLLVRGAQEPFSRWARPLRGLTLRVHNRIPIGRGLGSSAASIVAGIVVGAKLRGLRMEPQQILERAFPLEGHGDNLAAAIYGGFCIASAGDGGVRVHRLEWPARWRAVLFIPRPLSPTHEARRLVPRRPARDDAVFNLARVAELVLAVTTKDRSLLASAMRDRLHQPGRSRAYPYLSETIGAACDAGAIGAALSGAGGSVIAIADRNHERIGRAMIAAAKAHEVAGRVATLGAAPTGAVTVTS